MGRQHNHEPIHDHGQGQKERGRVATRAARTKGAGGGRREHRASGSHETNAGETGRDDSSRTSGGGSQGRGGGTNGGGTNAGHN